MKFFCPLDTWLNILGFNVLVVEDSSGFVKISIHDVMMVVILTWETFIWGEWCANGDVSNFLDQLHSTTFWWRKHDFDHMFVFFSSAFHQKSLRLIQNIFRSVLMHHIKIYGSYGLHYLPRNRKWIVVPGYIKIIYLKSYVCLRKCKCILFFFFNIES